MKPTIAILAGLVALFLIPAPDARAESKWLAPLVQECSLAPGSNCNVEATCPADMPYIVTGGGGMPTAPDDHRIAMTMNLPISSDTWRVRWRNLGRSDDVDIKVAVRIKCASSAAEAGW